MTGWLINNRNLFLMVPEAGKSGSRCWWIWCLVQAQAIDDNLLLYPPMTEGVRGLSEVSLFIRAPIPLMTDLPSCPNHLPKAPPPDTIIMGVRFHYMNFEVT